MVPELVERLEVERILTMGSFANFDDSKAEIRRVLREDWGYTAAAYPHARADIGNFLDAWERAKANMGVERSEAALARMSKLPCTLPSSEHLILLRAFEEKYWELEPEDILSETLVELRLNPLVKGQVCGRTSL